MPQVPISRSARYLAVNRYGLDDSAIVDAYAEGEVTKVGSLCIYRHPYAERPGTHIELRESMRTGEIISAALVEDEPS